MLEEKINLLRNKLNESVVSGDDYSVTYKLSIELDELIAEYYRNAVKLKKKTKEKEQSIVKA